MGTTGNGIGTSEAPSGGATAPRNESNYPCSGRTGNDDDDDGFYILTVPDDKWASPDLPLEAGHRNCVSAPGEVVSRRSGIIVNQTITDPIGGRGADGGAKSTGRCRRGPEEISAR